MWNLTQNISLKFNLKKQHFEQKAEKITFLSKCDDQNADGVVRVH